MEVMESTRDELEQMVANFSENFALVDKVKGR